MTLKKVIVDRKIAQLIFTKLQISVSQLEKKYLWAFFFLVPNLFLLKGVQIIIKESYENHN